MSIDKHRVICFFDYLNDNNLDAIAEILDENCEFFFPKTQPIFSKKDILRFFKILKFQYSELTFFVHEVLIDGDFSAVHWKNKGCNRKNEHYENEGVTLLKIKNNKIIYMSDFFKNTGNF